MSSTLDQIRELVRQGSVRISEHGYDELAADGILAREAVEGVVHARFLSKIIQIIQKVCAFWFGKQLTTGGIYTPSGAYQKVKQKRLYL